MKAALNKKLHERALAIIDMIDEANRRIKTQQDNIVNFEPHFFYTVARCEERIAANEKIIERLEQSYKATLERINKAA